MQRLMSLMRRAALFSSAAFAVLLVMSASAPRDEVLGASELSQSRGRDINKALTQVTCQSTTCPFEYSGCFQCGNNAYTATTFSTSGGYDSASGSSNLCGANYVGTCDSSLSCRLFSPPLTNGVCATPMPVYIQ